MGFVPVIDLREADKIAAERAMERREDDRIVANPVHGGQL